MIVRSEKIREEETWAVASIRAQDGELVRRRRVVDRRWDDDFICRTRTSRAGSGCGAIQIGRHGGLIQVFKTGQVNAVRTVIADVEEHGIRKLPLHIEAPLLRIRRLVVDGHSGLNGEWSC